MSKIRSRRKRKKIASGGSALKAKLYGVGIRSIPRYSGTPFGWAVDVAKLNFKQRDLMSREFNVKT